MTLLFSDLPSTPRAPRTRNPRHAPLTGIPAGQSLAAPWPLDGAINVVLFAGMGGACQGLEAAGYPVHVAVNHDAVAIAAHKALNPRTKHLQADIYEVCPLAATGGRPVNILWASPDCRDHSVAKGGAPRSPRVRSMPWQVCRWVGVLRRAGLGPATVMLENVREIRGWGPLIAKRDTKTGRVLRQDGTVAAKGERVPREQQVLVRDPRHIGRHWRAWVEHMRRLGVDWQDRDMVCADYGVPTTRKRLFGVGQLDGLPIIWPEQTHAHRHSVAVKDGRLLAHASAASIIDWSLPLPSIFSRKKALQPATQKRIAVGMKRFVLEAAEPFLVHTTHHGARPGHAMADALSTITGAHRGEMAMVGPALVPTTHTTSGNRIHDGQQPTPTFTAGVKGGELAVMAATVIGAGGRAAQTPPIDIHGALNTSTTKEDRCVVAAHLIQAAHGDGRPGGVQRWGAGSTDMHKPLGTTTASGHSHALVAAYLTEYYSVGGQHQDMGAALNTLTVQDRFSPTIADLAPSPLSPEQLARARQVAEFLRAHGVWTGGDIVTVTIAGSCWIIADIGMRMLKPHEAAAAHELAMPAAITLVKLDRQGRPVIGPDGTPVTVTRPLTKTEAMRLIGNSVPRRMAQLLARHNARHPLDIRRPAVAAE